MGQKIHPTGFRLPVTRDWSSRWFASGRNFSKMLHEDFLVRSLIKKKLAAAAVSRVLIERPAKSAHITVSCARPGVAIGKKGEDLEKLKLAVEKILGIPVHINIEEVRKPEIDAQLISDSIAQQLEKRVLFRRAMKRAIQNAMRFGAVGIKIASSGRLNGIEIARSEWYREGRVPLQKLRADIAYGFSEAKTTYGIIGVKVWVHKGDYAQSSQENAGVAPERPERARAPKKRSADAAARKRSDGKGPARARKAPVADATVKEVGDAPAS